MKKLLISAALGASLSGAASAAVIDFNAPIVGPSYSEQGIVFTPETVNGGNLDNGFGNSPNGTPGLAALDSNSGDFVPIRATIAGGTNFVSIDLGDFNQDADLLFLDAYDSTNTLLGQVTENIAGNFTGMKTLAFANPNIAYVIFGGVGVQGSSVYADNFTWNAGVPEPAAWAMMLAGFGLAGAAMRRRTRLTVTYA